ncbi:tRNA lysidine(34) synthetase TilS [Sphingomonas asaccharolytica]|uniref:tRNA lysidine(34) synthetase TilS n=1 Tax=Sphingomonas asaccharolytica TaxID=40681 RepID=UPI00082DD4FC|nr:tRNA lysidine(34) synthetase TilS [Sphingomonas asaccharolytica]
MPPTNAPELTRAVDPAALDRFADDLAALCAPATARVLVAVSGGPDSLALLLLTHALLGERCVAATVDHGLRPEAADEAAWVADLCGARAIDHAVLRGTLPDRAGNTGNLSARARALRYELLHAHADTVGATHIATAHHADDQVETLIMRLNRGAGVGGLAGVRARSGRVIRPLLGWRRAELGAIVAAAGIVAVDDPSNVSDRFDRARLRKHLAAIDWIDPARVAASASALADAEEAIGWMVRQLGTDRVAAEDDSLLLDPNDLPFELVRRLVEHCVRQIDPAAEIRGSALVRMVNALESGDTAMLGDVLATPIAAKRWRFGKAPPRRLL